MKLKFTLILAVLLSLGAIAQSGKSYFNRVGESAGETEAYYYRVSSPGNMYKSYYNSNDAIYFEGKITTTGFTESDNVYSGECKWYFKNGNLKSVRNFNSEGKEDGLSVFYYESGKFSKKVEYSKGKLKTGKFTEFNENGDFYTVTYDEFNNNVQDWDVYSSEKSEASFQDGSFVLKSLTDNGTSRFININSKGSNFSVEAEFDFKSLEKETKTGLVFGFKDWENYQYFLLKGSSMYIGSVYQGVNSYSVEGMFSIEFKEDVKNTLKVISLNGKDIFSLNGKVQMERNSVRLIGNKFGFAVGGTNSIKVDNFCHKEFSGSGSSSEEADSDVRGTGSGVLIGANGYVITNYHVIDDANSIQVQFNQESKSYTAEVVQKDVANDLAILKITDSEFKGNKTVNYSIQRETQQVGSYVFTIGFPLALSGMGKEAKFVDGKVSAKVGYDGALNSFQTSVPVQPGNSGGPLFNKSGELVGLVNAKIAGGDNVSYVIKTGFVLNLIDVLPEPVKLKKTNPQKSKSLESMIGDLKKNVVLVKIK